LFHAAIATAAVIPRTSWVPTVDSEELVGENGAGANAVDGNPATIWHTRWLNGAPPPPHQIQIDLGATYDVDGFRYLPRQDGSLNGTVAQYHFYVSLDGASWGPAVATGTFAKDATEKEVVFAAVRARYVRFRALTEVNGKPWTSVAEIAVLGTLSATQPSPLIAKSGWKFEYADSQETTGETAPAVQAFDGNPSTYWHTEWLARDPAPPHEIQIDLGASYDVDGLRYLPRQDGGTNGNIGQYEFYVSADGVTWGSPAATGTFTNSSAMKEVTFSARRGRWVRLRALTEASGRPWTAVAELDLTGAPASPNQLPDGAIDQPATDVTILAGQTVQFSGSASDPDGNLPLSLHWQFGPGIPGFDGAAPGHVRFDVPGTYRVTLSVTDAVGGTDPTPASRTVTVLVDPFAPLPDWTLVTRSPFDLRTPPGVTNPVLTAADVTDVPALYVADPFLFHEGDAWYMFFEVFNGQTGLGDIGLASSTDGLAWRYERIVLDEPFHLAQPLVFKYGGVYYMIPDTNQRNEIRLYTSASFPYQWTYLATLVSGKPFVDGSIFRYGDRWWMFASEVGNKNGYLYSSDTLTSGWVAHPRNPIVVNDRSKARPAGRPLVLDGTRVFRIAQKDDVSYGEQVRVFEVDVLTPTDYAEHEIPESPLFRASGSGWNARGMHHFDAWWIGGRWLVSTDGADAQDNWSIGIYESADPSAPNAVITAPATDVTVSAGASVDFRGSGTDPDGDLPLTFRWRFGAGSGIADSTVESPGLVRFDVPGIYDVTLTVTDALGHVDTSPATRRVTVLSTTPTVPKTGWTVKAIDSEEETGENGAAENAFDDNPATYWHTRWSGTVDPQPHEIQIDLGARYTIGGFRYLPRQDGAVNGRVKDYEFYTSEDGVTWGTPVAAGSFANDAATKEVTWSARAGRYVRFRSLSEVNGGPWTSAAELSVLGVAAPPLDVIFQDGFESGNTSAWASVVGGGDVSVTAAAALVGTRGLAFSIASWSLGGKYVRDTTPVAEPRYRARFYFDPNNIAMNTNAAHWIMAARNATAEVARVEFRSDGTNYQIRTNARTNSGAYTNSAWYTISDARHAIEIDWKAASTPTATNGSLSLWIDGVLRQTLTNLANGTLRVEEARLGPLGGLDSGTGGTEYFDAFVSSRADYIGP
jgi:hypothetical protein